MYKRSLSVIKWFLILLLLAGSYVPAQAGNLSQDIEVDGDSFTFAQIREQEIRMFGPFASHYVIFGLPANWELLEGAQLELDMAVAVRRLNAQAGEPAEPVYSGNLNVIINNQTVAVVPLAEDNQITEVVPIPLEALRSSRSDGRMEVLFILSSGETCLLDQQMSVTIFTSSRFVIPHNLVSPDTNFVNFPRPIFQDSIIADSARIVVPDQPTASELQSAFTVAAGLQARTGDGMLLDLVTNSELNEENLQNVHLILVGKPGSLPLYSQLDLPLNPTGNRFSSGDEIGVLEMIPSPWTPDRVVLVVSGNTDAAVIKAAQALSTGVIRSSQVTNLALVEQVSSVAQPSSTPIDQTLADLGYDNVIFEGRGETTETFRFYMPIGQTVASDAFFEISLNHTTLLNYNQSGVFVLLNDQPIGSVRLSDVTANQSGNLIRISIPPSAVRSGLNVLDVTAALRPVDECADPDQAGLFVTLWSDESRLFLPRVPLTSNLNFLPDLSSYPSPFVQSSTLGTTAFVVQNANPDSWRHAMTIAGDLGAIADGAIMTPVVFFADNVPEADRANYHFLVVGAPSKLPLIAEINNDLPAPFRDGSDMAAENNLLISYQIPPETPLGYLQLLSSPWNLNNVVVAALGNTPQGVAWAAGALRADTARARLSGNFAVINDAQILSTDTRVVSDIASIIFPTAAPPTEIPPPGTSISIPTNTASPGWVLTALMVTGGLIVFVILSGIYSSWARNRTRKQPRKEENGDSQPK